jgi:hypothetical protein
VRMTYRMGMMRATEKVLQTREPEAGSHLKATGSQATGAALQELKIILLRGNVGCHHPSHCGQPRSHLPCGTGSLAPQNVSVG